MEEEIVIVCASQRDADILSQSIAIGLVGGSSIILKCAPSLLRAPRVSEDLQGANDIYIFWFVNLRYAFQP